MSSDQPDDARLLGLAVIARAIDDFCSDFPIHSRSDNDARRARSEARSFLLEPSGEWRDARDAWCQVAGIEAAYLDRAVRDRLASPPLPPRPECRGHA